MAEYYSKEITWLLKNLLKAGLIYERRISKIGNSGGVYVHKDLIGRMARIIIIPLEEKQGVVTSKKNKETNIGNFDTESWKKDMNEMFENLKNRISELEKERLGENPIPSELPQDPDRFNIDTGRKE